MNDHPKNPEKQQLTLMRLQTIMTGLILLAVLISILFLWGDVRQVMEKVNSIDVQELNAAVTSLKSAADTLSQVDIEALNSGIGDLSTAAEGLSQLDFQKLGKFMDSLETLSTQMESISRFFSGFLK